LNREFVSPEVHVMKIPSRHSSRFAGFNMTPMIDVVFLLIIFFLVSSHLARQESRIPLPLPVAPSADEETTSNRPRITIQVDDAGAMQLGGQPIRPSNLAERLRQARHQLGEELEIRVRSSRHTPYHHVEPILLACTQAGIWNVTYAVYRQGETP
jgi:biopolymer transport protein ExbD